MRLCLYLCVCAGFQGALLAERKKFVFSCPKIFPEEASQQDVFEHTSLDLIQQALDGVNGTIFTYGPSCHAMPSHSIVVVLVPALVQFVHARWV